jgi:hypothetical protein
MTSITCPARRGGPQQQAHTAHHTQHRDQGLIDRVRRGKRSRASINDSPCSKQPQNRHCIEVVVVTAAAVHYNVLRSRLLVSKKQSTITQLDTIKKTEKKFIGPLETNWEKYDGRHFVRWLQHANSLPLAVAATWNTFVINYWFLGIAKSFGCIGKGRDRVTIVLRHRQLINNKIKLLLLKMDIQYMNLWWWSLAALFLL